MSAAPSEVRLPDWSRLSPTGVGLVAWFLLAAGSLGLTLAFGWAEDSPLELRFWRDARGWFDVVALSGLFGWTVGGSVALVRGARRDLEALRPALDPDTALPEVDRFPRRSLWSVTACGVVLGITINAAPAQWPGGFPGIGHPFFLWASLRTTLIVCAICLTGVIATSLARRFSRLGRELRLDLLDLRPLAPLGRCGLRSVAVWAGISAILAIMLLAPFGRSVNAGAIAGSAVIGVVAFLGPVRGARKRLIEIRDGELARVRAALGARLDGVSVSDARLAKLTLTDLLAWEQRVERVRTLPFDASTVLRFGLYVAIGLGSWIGAALVERALGAALG
ncbi:MAG: hypothetical protein ABFS46_01125 [Myxococcota bacterium]